MVNAHPKNIREYFAKRGNIFFIFNLDDYHNIHGIRRPDTVSLSAAIHFATCVSKEVPKCAPIPINYNGNSVHNPANIDAPLICLHLITKYRGIFDPSYAQRKNQWVTSQRIELNNFDQIDLLTVHCYDDAIKEKNKERSMEGVRLVGIKEGNLHSLDDYINALEMILSINRDIERTNDYVMPVVADWPGQLFIRKALTYLHRQNTAIPAAAFNVFVPILGPLHVSLNSREQVLITYYSFFKKLFHAVFGEQKILAKKPKPWRINLLLELAYQGWLKIKAKVLERFGSICKDVEYRMLVDLLDNVIPATLDVYAVLFRSGSFDEYVETIFRIWTFALRWNRKNYNKAPLAFLSDIFYWQDKNHPMLDVIKMFLVNFNDYFVENLHSQIRANTSPNDSAEAIIQQTCILGKLKNEITYLK